MGSNNILDSPLVFKLDESIFGIVTGIYISESDNGLSFSFDSELVSDREDRQIPQTEKQKYLDNLKEMVEAIFKEKGNVCQ